MAYEPPTFLIQSHKRVVEGYRRALATFPDMPPEERTAIEDRLQRAEAELKKVSLLRDCHGA